MLQNESNLCIFSWNFEHRNNNRNVSCLSETANETYIHLLYKTSWHALRKYGFISLHWYKRVTSQMCQQLETFHMGRCDENDFLMWLQQMSLELARTYYTDNITSPHQFPRLVEVAWAMSMTQSITDANTHMSSLTNVYMHRASLL